MPSDAYLMGRDLGLTLASGLANGISQWKQIQLERQQRKEFDGGIQLYNQRTLSARQGMSREDGAMLREYELMAKRYPDAKLEERPTNVVNEDGQVESEPVVRTPEGDIPVNQVLQLQARKQQQDSLLVLSDIDALMELQSRYPNNPLVKQFVASTYSGIQAKQELRFKTQQQQLKQVELMQAQQRFRLDEQRLAEEQRQFDAQPQRARNAEQFQTDEGIRRDSARIEAEKQSKLTTDAASAQNQPPKAPTEYDKKLGQLATRAREALDTYDSVEYDRTGVGAAVESMLPGQLQSGKRQQIEQAQLQLVNSVLRAESGATITPDEISKKIKEFFPQAGDSDAVVEQKRQARTTAVEAMEQSLGAQLPAKEGKVQRGPVPGALSKEEQALVEAVKAGRMSKEEARAKRAALRGQ